MSLITYWNELYFRQTYDITKAQRRKKLGHLTKTNHWQISAQQIFRVLRQKSTSPLIVMMRKDRGRRLQNLVLLSKNAFASWFFYVKACAKNVILVPLRSIFIFWVLVKIKGKNSNLAYEMKLHFFFLQVRWISHCFDHKCLFYLWLKRWFFIGLLMNNRVSYFNEFLKIAILNPLELQIFYHL